MTPLFMRSARVLLLATLVSTGFAQNPYRVLDWKSEYSLNAYLLQRMHGQYEMRRNKLDAALQSGPAAAAYAADCRQRFLQVLGPLPERAQLNAAVTGIVNGEGYNVEKVVYESLPGHHVTTNLYVPPGKGPFPGVLLLCGHEDAAKAAESYQETAILFVRNGFVVLIVDPVSQSERRQLTDSRGVPIVRGGTTEHTLLNAASNLAGTSTVAYELWDNTRGLDYLVSRPEVDSLRIGCLGNSGGGMQTVYFLAYDKRVKVAAVCSFLASRERNFDLSILSDGCSQMPGEGKMNLEMCDYVIASAPTPVLILSGRYDFIDYSGTLAAYNDIKRVFQVMGVPERVSLFTYDDGHGISKPKREAAVAWFRRWLCNDSVRIYETPARVLTEEELWCTSSGQVNSEFKGEITIQARNIVLADKLASDRAAFLRSGKQEIRESAKRLLSLHETDSPVKAERLGPARIGPFEWEKVILRRDGEIPLPILQAFPEKEVQKVVIWFSDRGKSRLADSVALMKRYLREGAAVLLCDLRGFGETADKAEFNDPKYYSSEYRNAMLAVHIGESLAGERVRDVRTVLDYVKSEQRLSHRPVGIFASGAATLPSLQTMLFEDSNVQLTLYRSLSSFKTILQKPMERDWYSYVIPGILHFYDIPDLIELVGRERVRVAD